MQGLVPTSLYKVFFYDPKRGGTMKDQVPPTDLPPGLKLYKLSLEHIKRIDEMLDDLGEYGELHIIVQRGELRYINKVESYKFSDSEGGQ
jgi:hypothetical protein